MILKNSDRTPAQTSSPQHCLHALCHHRLENGSSRTSKPSNMTYNPLNAHSQTPANMDSQPFPIVSWNVGGLGGKHRKYIIKNWIWSLAISPLIIGR